MINHVWSVLCSQATTDSETNNFSLQNIIERLTIFDSPKSGGRIKIHIEVASFWIRSEPELPTHGDFRLSYITPSGNAFGVFEGKINLSEKEVSRNRVVFEELPVEEEGRHNFKIDLKNENSDEWLQVALIPLSIIFSPPDNKEDNEEVAPMAT